MLALVCEMSRRNIRFLTDKKMAEVLGCNEKTVRTARKQLLAERLISCPDKERARYATNYQINVFLEEPMSRRESPKCPDESRKMSTHDLSLNDLTLNDILPLTDKRQVSKLVPVPPQLTAILGKLDAHNSRRKKEEYSGVPFPSKEVRSMSDRYHEVRGKVYTTKEGGK